MYPLILLYLVLTIIRPQDYMPALAGLPLLSGVMAGALGLWLLNRQKRLEAPQYLLLLLFTLTTAASVAVNNGFTEGWDELRTFAPALIAFTILANAVDRPERASAVMQVFAACTTVLAVHGILQAKHHIGWTGVPLSEDNRIQYIGIFQDPNDLGLLFVSVIPMAAYLSTRGGLQRLIWLACTTLMLYGVYLTKSRGAMLALAAIVGVYTWRKRGMVLAGTLGLACLVVMKLLSPRMQELNADESSAFGRVDAWYTGLHLFLEHPLLGVGTNNFTEYNDLTAHNSFVLVIAENGFVGYVLWLAFVCYGLWMSLTLVRYEPDAAVLADADQAAAWRRERARGMTMLLAQVGFVAAAFFLSRSYIIVLYLLEALVLGQYLVARQSFPGLPQFSLKRDLLRWPILAAASIVVMFVLVRVLLGTA
jgi:O-antigen ligase